MLLSKNKEINDLLDQYDILDVLDCCDGMYDGTCTTGFDNDGSTGFDIFENGLALGVKAKDQPIYYYESDEDDIALFFVGNLPEVLDRIEKGLQELDNED